MLPHGPRVVFAVAQGAKAVVGAFKNNWAPVCIKPYNRPDGRGENKQTALTGVGNAPLLPPAAASSPEGEILAALYND